MDTNPPRDGHVQAHVTRALEREAARLAVRPQRRASYGEDLVVYLFGSVLDPDRFRLDSDVDLAAQGLPAGRFYEAWETAEAAAGCALDLVSIEAAPAWLAAEIRDRGERLT